MFNKIIGIFLICFLLINCSKHKHKESKDVSNTVCNPLNLNYRFRPEEPSRREAADPTIIPYKNGYLLFASKSGGYWYSDDLVDWSFIKTDQIPSEEYAPTAVCIGDTTYFLASSLTKSTIYKSIDPLNGKWEVARDSLALPVWDPAFYMDDNNRLYLYWGCSDTLPIYGVELDYDNNFVFKGTPQELLIGHPEKYGWERPEDYNNFNGSRKPWIEGPWITKHDDTYYLQYAAPGTEYKSYSDGVYISKMPLGPYKLAAHNPFSYKPEGFIAGAGHGSTFRDKYGNYWHIATMSISIKHKFERRLGLFPAFFDNDGTFYTYTALGDFPHSIPNKLMKGPEDYQPTSFLLSFNKPVEVSSAIDNHVKENATDENIRTYWSAETGNIGEWIVVDLQQECEIDAVQINFAEESTTILGRKDSISYQYLIECSTDKKNWQKIVDKRLNTEDCPHDFIQLQELVDARYLRLVNHGVPDGKFAVSGLRIFGNGKGESPQPVADFTCIRDNEDARNLTITWQKSKDAIGYNIRYGTSPDKLYLNYQVYNADTLTIHSLNCLLDYYFTIDAFNENGISKGKIIKSSLIK